MIRALLKWFQSQTYALPSLAGRPNTNHNRVRQISARVDGVVNEVCLTPKPEGTGLRCPDCLHGIDLHQGYCRIEFEQTDRLGIKRIKHCCCLMTPDEIKMNSQGQTA